MIRGLKGYLERSGATRLVGARSKERDYSGPCARVDYNDEWLHIVTDDYEGCAMLNIEALPYLQKALAEIAKERKAKSSK